MLCGRKSIMQHYIITCRTLTYAQRAVRALQNNGLYASLMRTPAGLSKNGCGYGVRVRERDLARARSIITAAGVDVHGVFELDAQGGGA